MKRRLIILILILILVDQAIKVLIAKFLMEPHVHVTLIYGVLNFCPMQNKHLGWIPSMLDYMMPVYMAALLVIIAMVMIVIAYRYLKFCAFNWDKYKNLPNIFLTIFLSGASCSLIDGIFWGGSIDYIRLFDWFTFDLKDVYITFGEVVIFFYTINFLMRYFKLSKEERKEIDKKLNLFQWIKYGLPLEHK